MKLIIKSISLIALVLALSSLPSKVSSSAIDSPSSTTLAPTSFPTPGQSCTGDTSFCIGDSTPIILRCENGSLQPGNCDDNLNEPEFGAICVAPPGLASSASCSAFTPPTSTSTTSIPFPTPSQSCTGDTSFCIEESTPIILRCENGSLQPGNCDDNLNEPEFGAICVTPPGLASSASCSAFTPPTSTSTSSISFPTPGQSCTGDTSFCIGESTPIILRCENGSLQPGNCDDNLNEPEFGAICVTPPGLASSASCSAEGPPTSTITATDTGIAGTGSYPGGPSTTAANGTFPGSSSPTPTSSSPPFATGAADSTRSWAGAAMVGVAALVAGGAMVL